MPDSNPTPHAETRERIEFSFSLPWHAVGPVFDAPASDAARIQVYAPMGGGDSYAGVAAAVAGEIAASFDAVALCDYTGGEPRVPALRERHGLNRRADVAVFLGFPTHVPDWFFDHPVTIGLFVCEADRILPEWVRLCNRFDLVVVPSTFCRTAFRASGVTAPLAVVPHGVHPVFRPGPRTRRDDRLVFHAAFRHHVAERKGYPQLRRAFSRAFAGRTDVALSIATTDRRWLPAAEPDPRVEFLPAWDVGVEEIAQRYRDADCVVCPSRGEGFGLVPLEAIACGTPVISPAHTGLADFLTEDNAIVLEPGALIRAPRIDHLCGLYYDVDESDLERCLRRAADRLDDERERARRASGDIRARYPWRVVLEPLVRLVG
ncbi:MAG: glycosyltransferase, partial [Proteobacteria bacterium]